MEKQDSRVLIHWEGNSGDKLIEHQTSATGWYYQVDRSFSQPKGEPPRMIQRHWKVSVMIRFRAVMMSWVMLIANVLGELRHELISGTETQRLKW